MYSEKTVPDKPLSAGFYRLEKGTPLVYTYSYEEMKIIVEGEFEISDETGQKVTATKGDVFYFPKGSTITFTTPDYGLAFFVSTRPNIAGIDQLKGSCADRYHRWASALRESFECDSFVSAK